MSVQKKNTLKINNPEVVLNLLKPFILHCLKLNHDINNPLAGIIGYTEFLLDEEESLNINQREYIKQIMTCAERIEDEINKLCAEKIELSQEIKLSEFFATEPVPDL